MALNNLRPPKGMKHAKKRIGRGQGSGNGKTAGRGHKGATVKVTLMKSPTGFNGTQKTVVKSLGLLRIRHSVELKDTPETRGMIHKVRHLVEVQ